MNHKILHKLEQMIHVSPQLIRNPETMRQAIRGTFAVEVEDVGSTPLVNWLTESMIRYWMVIFDMCGKVKRQSTNIQDQH